MTWQLEAETIHRVKVKLADEPTFDTLTTVLAAAVRSDTQGNPGIRIPPSARLVAAVPIAEDAWQLTFEWRE